MDVAVLQFAFDWLGFVAERRAELWFRTGEHLILVGASTGAAILLGVPLGVLASTNRSLRTPLLTAVGVLQTVPSLAMLAILLALIGKIGAAPAIVALTIYALLPIVRNTVAGLDGVAPAIAEAARGVGMTRTQRLTMVELPLAMPVVVAGVRTAAVVGVGVATLSAFIGAGGLGQFINRGLALSNMRLVLLGAIPAALLAVIVDGVIAATEWGIRPTRQNARRGTAAKLKRMAIAAPLLLLALGMYAALASRATVEVDRNATIRIGSKNFTEQLLLGEMMAQMIEAHSELAVERRFNLGGTMICHQALAAGEIDLYAEYSGTGLTIILNQPAESDAEKVLGAVREEYRRQFDLEWLAPFGFSNSYALTVRKEEARANHWKTISDLAPAAKNLRAGFSAEFSARDDGYRGLRKAYGFRFGDVRDIEPSLMYRAAVEREVDVIAAFSTDGRIVAYDLQPLVDDRRFFPPYQAAPIVRRAALQRHPEISAALARLAGMLDDVAMQRLNYEVDEKGRRPKEVAREFLQQRGLIKSE
jgi:osmoprotectant transport system permease protein